MKTHIHFSMMRICLLSSFLIFYIFSFQESKADAGALVSKIDKSGMAQQYASSFGYLVQEKHRNGKTEVSLNFFLNNGNLQGILEKLTQGGFPLCEGRESEFIKKLGTALTSNANTNITTQSELSSAIQDRFFPNGRYHPSSSTPTNMAIVNSVNAILTENLECIVDKNAKEETLVPQPDPTPPSEVTCGDPDNPFNSVLCSGAKFFGYIRTLAALASAFALVAFSVNAIFGNVNWKWFMGVVFGLMVISLTGALVDFIVEAPDAQVRGEYINDTLW